MFPEATPVDTEVHAMQLLVNRWRSMTVAERVASIDQLNADVETLATVGIRFECPWITDIQLQHELARRRFGDRLADEAYRSLLR